jgi:hypothetical protein
MCAFAMTAHIIVRHAVKPVATWLNINTDVQGCRDRKISPFTFPFREKKAADFHNAPRSKPGSSHPAIQNGIAGDPDAARLPAAVRNCFGSVPLLQPEACFG